MDKQAFHYYRKNTIYLFIIAALLIAVSMLATVLVLVPVHMLVHEMPVLVTIVLWITLLLATVFGEGKRSALFNVVISIMGFICAFVLAVSVFVKNDTNALSLFLFWISQILSSVFILSTYFSIQAYLEASKKVVRKVSIRKSKPKTKTSISK